MAIEFEELPDGLPQTPDVSRETEGGEEPPKRRRGRPPGSGTGDKGGAKPRLTAADKRNVEAALASMNSLYTLSSMGILALGKPQTATLISTQVDQWQAGNRQAFEASPALAARVASAGQVSGTLIFAATNLMAAGTVLMALREEAALQRAQREAANPQPEPDEWNG